MANHIKEIARKKVIDGHQFSAKKLKDKVRQYKDKLLTRDPMDIGNIDIELGY